MENYVLRGIPVMQYQFCLIVIKENYVVHGGPIGPCGPNFQPCQLVNDRDRDLGSVLGRNRVLGQISVSAENEKISTETETSA